MTPHSDSAQSFSPVSVASSDGFSAFPGFLCFTGRTLGAVSGGFWLAVGLFLAFRGVLLDTDIHSTTLLALGATLAMILAVLKGQTVLRKMAMSNLARLSRLPQPSPLYRLFPRSTWVLIVFFMALGLAIRLSPLPFIVRSTVLLAVGMALLIGSIHYFRNLPLASPTCQTRTPKRR